MTQLPDSLVDDINKRFKQYEIIIASSVILNIVLGLAYYFKG